MITTTRYTTLYHMNSTTRLLTTLTIGIPRSFIHYQLILVTFEVLNTKHEILNSIELLACDMSINMQISFNIYNI